MEIACISVPNPLSYLICYGIADVENRGYSTDYRGPLYIHSIGRRAISGMPDLSEYPVPLIREFDALMQRISEIEERNEFLDIPENGLSVALKNESAQSERAIAEYSLLTDVYEAHRADPRKPFFRVQAIIGRVDLVDVVKSSGSPWARDDSYHWVFENAVLAKEPVLNVSTSRTGLWKYTLSD